MKNELDRLAGMRDDYEAMRARILFLENAIREWAEVIQFSDLSLEAGYGEEMKSVLAAPTVKAEQAEPVENDAFQPGSLSDLLFQLGERGVSVSGGTHGDRWRVSLPNQTTSLPAAGLAVEDEAWLQEWARDKFTYTGRYKGREVYGNTDWALARALHADIVAALSAQQSAPELVSVPVEAAASSAQLREALLKVRGGAINARECIGGIRQGQNVTATELWGACEHLDAAITCASAAIKGDV